MIAATDFLIFCLLSEFSSFSISHITKTARCIIICGYVESSMLTQGSAARLAERFNTRKTQPAPSTEPQKHGQLVVSAEAGVSGMTFDHAE